MTWSVILWSCIFRVPTHIPDHNRTAINFIHVNDRSLYIDWRIVVVIEGNVLHHVKREGELSRQGKCPGEYIQEECPDPAWKTISEVPTC